ncbi:hypothetical protein CEK25_002673 [Fusarium fujikuroi]|nr:hypothetical protein CEK25_002673 [Fusarium fujikuroi]
MASSKDKWSADQYVKFLKDRTRPSTDLLAHVPNTSPRRVVDVGCGPGNSTAVLAERYPNAHVSGFDSSTDMIKKAKQTLPNVSFEVADLLTYKPEEPVDVLFSNAVFQWLPNGQRLEIVRKLFEHVAPGGSLAFQVPYNLEEPSHNLMRETAETPNMPWTEKLKVANYSRDQFPSPTEIWDGLKHLCSDLDIWQTTYMHVMENHEGIVEWVKGTGLRPYLDPLSESEQEAFVEAYLNKLKKGYSAQKDGKQISGSMSSFIEIETSPLLAESNTDEAKRVRDEAKATLKQKYPTLVDMAAIDILKVFGAMREARLEIAELCISISFPLVILQCRSLSNLLASLSAFDDHGKVPEMTWHARNLSMLGKLENGFGYSWRYQWCLVFERWSDHVKDYHWLSDKTGDLQSNVAHIRPIFLLLKEAFLQIDKMAGTSLVDLLSDVQHAFDMFEHRLGECSAKADELRVEQERPKHLSPFVNSSSGQSWSSGSNIPSGGITQRTSFGRDGNTTAVQMDNSSTKPKERRLTKLRQRFSINPDARENHWTTLFGLGKSPVVLILTTAMPPTIYSTILCGPPDVVPALDSNFYSTLSQFISSLAGLYVIVKPIFSGNKKDQIKTSFPKTFYTMLTLSLLTSLTSAVTYAWSPAASIPLAYVSGLTLNIATLLIIQDSGNQIKETNRYNEDLLEDALMTAGEKEREEGSPAVEAPGSDEGPPSKRQRGFIARQACEYCRQKKTRCDEDFPCGLCKSLGLQCKFTQRKATRNEASLGMIVNILRRIEGKIDDSKPHDSHSTEHRSIAAALRPFNPRSPANSSEVLGVPSFLRHETIDSPAAPTDPNPAISFSAHQMQGGTYSTRLEASRPKLSHAASVDISSDWLSKLSIATLKQLSDVYFTTFNLANPILDQKTYFQRTLGVAIDGNFGICIESCIVLVVMALGSMGQKALQEAGLAGTPASSPYAGQEGEMPGLDFFNEARKRFGFLMCEQDLQACQFYLLSGLFYAEALRPIDWWAMLSKASACSAYFWNNLSRDRDEWMLDMQSRLFWITSMFEAVLSQELNLPPSNSLHLEEHIALPKFISAQDIASFGSFRYPGDDPFFHYHFLSQLAHRLILTRARNSLFHFNPTADYPPEPVEDELIRQLEQWRERLPPMLQFDPKSPLTQAESPSDALVTAWLHARYFVARYHIGRPLL